MSRILRSTSLWIGFTFFSLRSLIVQPGRGVWSGLITLSILKLWCFSLRPSSPFFRVGSRRGQLRLCWGVLSRCGCDARRGPLVPPLCPPVGSCIPGFWLPFFFLEDGGLYGFRWFVPNTTDVKAKAVNEMLWVGGRRVIFSRRVLGGAYFDLMASFEDYVWVVIRWGRGLGGVWGAFLLFFCGRFFLETFGICLRWLAARDCRVAFLRH